MKDLNKNKKGYKHTPVGWIPEDWEVKPLGNFISIKSGNSPANYTMGSTGSFLYLKVEDLNNSNKYQYLSRFYVEEGSNKIEKGSIIFPKRGAAILNNKVRILIKDSYMDSNLMSIKVNSDEVFNEFLYYYIIFVNLSKIADTSTIPQINNKHIEPYKFRKPSYTEQVNIANILCSWDKAIETTQKLIIAKEQLKKGLMQQLLTGKKRLPGFNSEWKKVRIGEVVKEVKRPIEWNEDKLYDLISIRRRSVGVFYRESLYGHQILTKGLFTAKAGDFLISKMQIVHGASGIVKKEHDGMFISGSYISLHSKDENKLNIEFFDWLSKTPEFYHLCFTSSYGVHIEKMTFDFQDFLHRHIFIPTDINEQVSIVKVLNTLVKEIDLLKSQLELYRQQKKGLMQVLLTGAVRVKV